MKRKQSEVEINDHIGVWEVGAFRNFKVWNGTPKIISPERASGDREKMPVIFNCVLSSSAPQPPSHPDLQVLLGPGNCTASLQPCRVWLRKSSASGSFHKCTGSPPLYLETGFPGGSAGKESACNAGDPGFDPGVGKIPWRWERPPTPVFWPGESRELYSPWGRKESDTTERLSLS